MGTFLQENIYTDTDTDTDIFSFGAQFIHVFIV